MTESYDNRRVLCVDDETNVLEGLERSLFESFDVLTAKSGADGLGLIRAEGPFAAVVSDMRMPEMDGAAFLSAVKRNAPDTVRILLTGHADVDAAIAAVNRGNIYRFLCKPCPQDQLVDTLEEAIRLFRLVTAERDLLEKTLKGSVKVLTDVLSLAAPVAFSRAGPLKSYISHMVKYLELKGGWKFELAAMLSQIGCITLPTDTLDRVYAGREISESEQKMLEAHPETGYRLLSNIPRLEPIAEMIRRQDDLDAGGPCTEEVKTGAMMLKAAQAVDLLVTQGQLVHVAARQLQSSEKYDQQLLIALEDYRRSEGSEVVKSLRFKELRTFMILAEDVRAANGYVIFKKDREINNALLEKLSNFAAGIGVIEPIRVKIPT